MNLYEIDFIRKYEEQEPLLTYWQIPAQSEWNACAKVGQIVESDGCKISIIAVRLVSRHTQQQ